MSAKEIVTQLLGEAKIEVGGAKPWDIQVHNDAFYSVLLKDPALGVGESYMDKWWDVDRIDAFVDRLLRAELHVKIKNNKRLLFQLIRAKFFNLQSVERSKEVGERHYDIGNDLYNRMLDKRLVYTCGYFKDTNDLDEAQEAKLDLICKKINLQKGQKVLDIGCGWGSFAQFAAEKYGAHVVGVTISKEQLELGQERCKGLDVELRLQDYRDVNETFDHIISIGMFEHVGYKNYRTYMEMAHRCLKDRGCFLLHTIAGNASTKSGYAWIDKYIFPGAMLPSLSQISKAAERLFVVEDVHNFGPDYDKTLCAWYDRFEKSWPDLKEKYGETFYRMWRFYLLSCAGNFRSRDSQLFQVLLSKGRYPEPFRDMRVY